MKCAEKLRFKSKAAAIKKRKRLHVGLFIYRCDRCEFFHLTRIPQGTEAPPSLARLRRRLENQTKVIAAFQRRFDAAQATLAEAQRVHAEEMACIAELYRRQHS